MTRRIRIYWYKFKKWLRYSYKGYGGFNEKEECEKSRPIIEDMIANVEMGKGTPSFYIDTFCMEMYAFPSQWGAPRKGDEVNPAEFGA